MKSAEVWNCCWSVDDQVEHLRLDRRVEAGRGLVEDEERRVLRERHRDQDALLHPARELVRIACHDRLGIGDLHVRERLACPLAPPPPSGAPDAEDLRDLLPDPDRRVQRRARVLVDHRDCVRAELPQLARREPSTSRPSDLDRAAAARGRSAAGSRRPRARPSTCRSPTRRRGRRTRSARIESDRSEITCQVAASDAVGDVEVANLERGSGTVAA